MSVVMEKLSTVAGYFQADANHASSCVVDKKKEHGASLNKKVEKRGTDVKTLQQAYHNDGQILVLSANDAKAYFGERNLTKIREQANALRDNVHYVTAMPIRKGGALSWPVLQKSVPAAVEQYHDKDFIKKLEDLVLPSNPDAKQQLVVCPDTDTHAAACYFYTRKDDFINWHYDSSWYAGKRFTILMGLENDGKSTFVNNETGEISFVDEEVSTTENEDSSASEGDELAKTVTPETNPKVKNCKNGEYVSSSLLEYRCPKTNEIKATPLRPGEMVIFHGGDIHHRVTKMLNEGEQRVVFTMEYVTDPSIGFISQAIMDVKEKMVYFGGQNMVRRAYFAGAVLVGAIAVGVYTSMVQ